MESKRPKIAWLDGTIHVDDGECCARARMYRCDCGDSIHVQYTYGGYMESCATCDDFWIDASVTSRKCPKCGHSSDEVYEFTNKERIKRIACRGCDEGFDLDSAQAIG